MKVMAIFISVTVQTPTNLPYVLCFLNHHFVTSFPLCSLLKAHVTHNVGILTMISQDKNHTVSFIQWEKKCHHTETLKVLSLTIK